MNPSLFQDLGLAPTHLQSLESFTGIQALFSDTLNLLASQIKKVQHMEEHQITDENLSQKVSEIVNERVHNRLEQFSAKFNQGLSTADSNLNQLRSSVAQCATLTQLHEKASAQELRTFEVRLLKNEDVCHRLDEQYADVLDRLAQKASQQAVETIRGKQSQLSEKVASMDDTLQQLGSRVAKLEDSLHRVDSFLSSVKEVKDIVQTVAELRSSHQTQADQLQQLNAALQSLNAEVQSVHLDSSRQCAELQRCKADKSVEQSMADAQREFQSVQQQLSSLQSKVATWNQTTADLSSLRLSLGEHTDQLQMLQLSKVDVHQFKQFVDQMMKQPEDAILQKSGGICLSCSNKNAPRGYVPSPKSIPSPRAHSSTSNSLNTSSNSSPNTPRTRGFPPLSMHPSTQSSTSIPVTDHSEELGASREYMAFSGQPLSRTGSLTRQSHHSSTSRGSTPLPYAGDRGIRGARDGNFPSAPSTTPTQSRSATPV